MDAFNDLLPIMRGIIERAENTRPAHGQPTSSDPVSDLLKGAGAQPQTVQ